MNTRFVQFYAKWKQKKNNCIEWQKKSVLFLVANGHFCRFKYSTTSLLLIHFFFHVFFLCSILLKECKLHASQKCSSHKMKIDSHTISRTLMNGLLSLYFACLYLYKESRDTFFANQIIEHMFICFMCNAPELRCKWRKAAPMQNTFFLINDIAFFVALKRSSHKMKSWMDLFTFCIE